MELRRHFTDHPATVGESYLEHMKVASGFARTLAKATVACTGTMACTVQASGFARTLAKATVACTVHAIVPSMCEKTASTAIKDLHARMTAGARGELADAEASPISIAS